ncbi:beta-lactamase [Arthroderma uncinatum]|uniref:beta-lactamase n=1 Tax=Arthroderma uncinatum TaxID=74035 RepID=UPI00144AD644|nr:beta-lactamase [Arthroderma uncinatum]KAF3480030.1 beta-lactamase [Arthroderma uncinatum]
MDLLRSSEFSAYVKKIIDHRQIPGIAVAVIQGNGITSTGFGKARVNPLIDFTPDTPFSVGSASKSLTAAAVALLVSDNENYPQVQYGATMASLLPDDFVMPGKDHGDVTVEDILSHRTGMAAHEYSLLGSKAGHPDDARSITRNLRNLSTVAPNRHEYIYCNMMYSVATYLVEHISGMSFSDFLDKHLFQLLKMDSTTLQPSRAQAKGLGARMAAGYLRANAHRELQEVPYSDRPESQGAGQIITTANDYAKWVKAMINREGPITEEIYQSLTKARIEQDPSEVGDLEHSLYYCLGWQAQKYCGYTIVSHDGGDYGSQCDHFFIPELKFGGVVFCNADYTNTTVSQIKYHLVDQMISGRQNGKILQANADSSSLGSEADSESGSEDGQDELELEQELRQELCPGIKTRQPQVLPLSSYAGQYWNPGYKGIKVESKQGVLFADCTDRSLSFTLTFRHVCNQTKYLAFMSENFETNDFPLKAEFVLENNNSILLGLLLDHRVGEYIWFERVNALVKD